MLSVSLSDDPACVDIDLGILLRVFMRGYKCKILPILYRSIYEYNYWIVFVCKGCKAIRLVWIASIVLGMLLRAFMRGCYSKICPILYPSMNLLDCVLSVKGIR